MTAYCIEELSSLLCGDLTGKDIQKRGDMCEHAADSFSVQQRHTRHCEATMLQFKKITQEAKHSTTAALLILT